MKGESTAAHSEISLKIYGDWIKRKLFFRESTTKSGKFAAAAVKGKEKIPEKINYQNGNKNLSFRAELLIFNVSFDESHTRDGRFS